MIRQSSFFVGRPRFSGCLGWKVFLSYMMSAHLRRLPGGLGPPGSTLLPATPRYSRYSGGARLSKMLQDGS